MSRQSKLTDRERRVIDLYFTYADMNKTEALRMAGYSHPNNQSTRFFDKPLVAAEVERRRAEMKRKYDVTYDSVMQEMAKIAFGNIGDFMEFDKATDEFVGFNLTADQMQEIAVIGELTVETYIEGRGEDAERIKRVRLKPYNKLSALEAVIRHAGLSKDKVQTNVEVTLVERLREGRERVFGRKKDENDGDK